MKELVGATLFASARRWKKVGEKMDPTEQHDRRPVMFPVGTIIIGILVIVLAAFFLRKPVTQASPYDASKPIQAPPASAEPATQASKPR
jgi:hypothetical protein